MAVEAAQKKLKEEKKINAIRNREKQSKTSTMAWHLISAFSYCACTLFLWERNGNFLLILYLCTFFFFCCCSLLACHIKLARKSEICCWCVDNNSKQQNNNKKKKKKILNKRKEKSNFICASSKRKFFFEWIVYDSGTSYKNEIKEEVISLWISSSSSFFRMENKSFLGRNRIFRFNRI